jgi:hypothetical protein
MNTDIDLENKQISNIPEIYFNDIYSNITQLFLGNNNIKGMLDLTFFKKLEILDIDNNFITSIKLHDTTKLIELCCSNNLLTSIPVLNHIKRLKIANNKISSIQNINKNIEILEINNNNITQCDLSEFKLLKTLIIYTNPLTDITICDSLIYIDISETLLTNIKNLYNIETLVLNNCKNIQKLPLSNKIKNLELINTNIEKIKYYENYEFIISQLNKIKFISKKYKMNGANIEIKQNRFLVISSKIYNNIPIK